MMEVPLIDYVRSFAVRGACTCGHCADAPPEPEKQQPNGHTADVYFFQVATIDNPKAEDLRRLIRGHRGVHCDCDPFDKREHSYIELGGWVGDQGTALMLMGLGTVLGLWQLLTPKLLPNLPKDLMDRMAGQGYVSIKA